MDARSSRESHTISDGGVTAILPTIAGGTPSRRASRAIRIVARAASGVSGERQPERVRTGHKPVGSEGAALHPAGKRHSEVADDLGRLGLRLPCCGPEQESNENAPSHFMPRGMTLTPVLVSADGNGWQHAGNAALQLFPLLGWQAAEHPVDMLLDLRPIRTMQAHCLLAKALQPGRAQIKLLAIGTAHF